MSVKEKTSEWVDPDDAPELGAEFFEKATRHIAGKEVSKEQFQAFQKTMGRPRVAVKRPTLTMRVDAEILQALRASGKGWQTRVNELLRREVLRK
jgi:uncharacterized protein (DUF4415 family)